MLEDACITRSIDSYTDKREIENLAFAFEEPPIKAEIDRVYRWYNNIEENVEI